MSSSASVLPATIGIQPTPVSAVADAGRKIPRNVRSGRPQLAESSALVRPMQSVPGAGLLKDRSVTTAADDLVPEETLFLFLTSFHSEETARSLARRLLSEFGSLGAILSAPHPRLSAVLPGLGDTVTLLKNAQRLMVAALREPLENRVYLRNWSQLHEYLRVSLAHEQDEVLRILFLNKRNALLKDELHSRGTVDHVPVYPREIAKRALANDASALILVHNHPSGDPNPSEEDVDTTREVSHGLATLGILLHDHVVVGRHRCFSMRAAGLL
jgi:DNA repair protein RadC